MKALQIAWKDTLSRVRDWKALVGLLGAPLIISGLIGLAFGNIDFGGNQSPLTHIPVILVNQDAGQLGQAYEGVLTSPGLDELLDVTQMDDLQAAREQIAQGNVRAVVYIPPDFSNQIIPAASGPDAQVGQASVQLFTDPTANVSPYIMQSIVEQISADANTVLLAGELSAQQAAGYAAILGPRLAQLAQILPEELNQENFDFQTPRLSLDRVEVGQAEANTDFNAFAYFVPGMAVFFLMFSMFEGSRSILLEESRGTLPRLMTTPTSTAEIILGKMGGTFLTGVLQIVVLMLASWLIFGLSWGHSPLGLALIVLLTVFAASGLGAFLTSFARNQVQAGVVGSTVSLVFGALGGSFFPSQYFTGFINVASKFTLNRWAMDGLTKLTLQDMGLRDIVPEALVLAAIGLVTYVLAIWAFRRRFVK